MEKLDIQPAQKSDDDVVGCRLNATGNIFISTTSFDGRLGDDSRSLLKGAAVMLSAMTEAMRKNGKDLFDYDAWLRIISGCGYFVEMQSHEKKIEIRGGQDVVGDQIIRQLLPGLKDHSSIGVARNVLSAVGGKLRALGVDGNSRVGHLMLLYEEIMGSSSVVLRVFHATRQTHAGIVGIPCNQTATSYLVQNQSVGTYLFVDSNLIRRFSGIYDCASESVEYRKLVDFLAKF